MSTQNKLKVLEKAVKEIKELKDSFGDGLFLQIDNSR